MTQSPSPGAIDATTLDFEDSLYDEERSERAIKELAEQLLLPEIAEADFRNDVEARGPVSFRVESSRFQDACLAIALPKSKKHTAQWEFHVFREQLHIYNFHEHTKLRVAIPLIGKAQGVPHAGLRFMVDEPPFRQLSLRHKSLALIRGEIEIRPSLDENQLEFREGNSVLILKCYPSTKAATMLEAPAVQASFLGADSLAHSIDKVRIFAQEESRKVLPTNDEIKITQGWAIAGTTNGLIWYKSDTPPSVDISIYASQAQVLASAIRKFRHLTAHFWRSERQMIISSSFLVCWIDEPQLERTTLEHMEKFRGPGLTIDDKELWMALSQISIAEHKNGKVTLSISKQSEGVQILLWAQHQTNYHADVRVALDARVMSDARPDDFPTVDLPLRLPQYSLSRVGRLVDQTHTVTMSLYKNRFCVLTATNAAGEHAVFVINGQLDDQTVHEQR